MEGGAERRIVTVLFADLVGFTSLSEALDPEDVALVQRAYFDGVRETIGRYGGVLEKFVGDAVMAVFGAPRARDDDAERAVRAGLALAASVEQLAGRLELEGDLALRVGVNSGEVVQAERGREDEALVTGDAVNVAARLQALADPGRVLVGETTALAVAEAVELEEHGPVELKGKREPVRVWRVAGVRAERSRDEAMGMLRAPLLGRDAELAELSALVETRRARARARRPSSRRRASARRGSSRELAARSAAPVWTARLRPDALAPYDAVRQLLDGALGDTGARRVWRSVCARAALRSTCRGRRRRRLDGASRRVGGRRRRAGPRPRGAVRSWIEALDASAPPEAAPSGSSRTCTGRAPTCSRSSISPAVTDGRRLVLADGPALAARVRAGVGLQARSVLQLAPLPAASTAELVRALVGNALADALTERIAEVSDGNPLFVEELLRSWVSAGTLVPADGGWRLTRPVEEVSLPQTVQAVYGAQLDDLPPAARAVARRGSVPGRTFPVDALEELGAGGPQDGVSTLERRALVAGPATDGVLGPSYSFRHALLRDAGYASLSRAERAALHARYAGWLEAVAGERAGEVAELVGRHLERSAASAPALQRELVPGLDRAEARRRAAGWFERAAEAALDVAAHEAARALLHRSLELTPAAEAVEEARRRARLGEVTAQNADMDEGALELERALGAYRDLLAAGEDVRDGYARVAAVLGWVRNQQVRFDLAAELAEDGLALLGERDDAPSARLLVLRAVALNHGTDDVERPLADAERGLAVARALGDAELELDALRALGQVRGRLADWRELARAATARGRWGLAADAHRTQAAIVIESDPEEAAAALDRAEDLCRARGLTESLAWTEYTRAELGQLYGDWDGAIAAGRRAIELGVANAYHRVTLRTWSCLLPIAAARRDEALGAEAQAWISEFEAPGQSVALRPHPDRRPRPARRRLRPGAALRTRRGGAAAWLRARLRARQLVRGTGADPARLARRRRARRRGRGGRAAAGRAGGRGGALGARLGGGGGAARAGARSRGTRGGCRGGRPPRGRGLRARRGAALARQDAAAARPRRGGRRTRSGPRPPPSSARSGSPSPMRTPDSMR